MSKVKKTTIIGKECVACGSCVKCCSFGAITVYKGLYAVVDNQCIGCGKCAKTCPAGVIEIVEKEEQTA